MNFLLKPIKTELEYQEALDEMKIIMNTPDDELDTNYVEMLIMLIQKYEDAQYPIPAPDPIEAIKYRMEQLEFSVTDLGKVIGHVPRASEILNKKRKLTLKMIRKISVALNIPTDILIQAY